eukprot:gene2735-3552_t
MGTIKPGDKVSVLRAADKMFGADQADDASDDESDTHLDESVADSTSKITPTAGFYPNFTCVAKVWNESIGKIEHSHVMKLADLNSALLDSRDKLDTVVDAEIEVSLPAAAMDWFEIPRHATTLSGSLTMPKVIQSWIFTPSFCGKGLPGPNSKLLNRGDALSLPRKNMSNQQLKRWEDYGEILVVRSSQFEEYRNFYSNTHIIVAMPNKLRDKYGKEYSVDRDGIGYARRVCQLFAHYLGFDAIWMVDDY